MRLFIYLVKVLENAVHLMKQNNISSLFVSTSLSNTLYTTIAETSDTHSPNNQASAPKIQHIGDKVSSVC